MSAEDKFEAIDALTGIGLAALLMLVVAFGFCLFKDHNVTRYYVGDGSDHTTKGFAVMAETPWDQDPIVYCSDNIEKAEQVMASLNEQLRNAPGAAR